MERYSYLALDLLSVAFPLMASFERRLHFRSKWPGLFRGIGVMAAIFLVWDALFTDRGVWGFEARYLIGIQLFGLPLEECLFFFFIPYACLFLYEAMRYFVPRDVLGNMARPLSLLLILILALVGVLMWERIYTCVTFLCTAALLTYVVFVEKPGWLGRFYLGYAVSFVPFLLVNGILTGSLLPEPIVWYDPAEILGIRIHTIPIEDSVYLLCMLLLVTLFYERPLARDRG